MDHRGHYAVEGATRRFTFIASGVAWRFAVALLLMPLSTIRPLMGQGEKEKEKKSAKIDIQLNYRPGQEVTTDPLRGFIAKNVVIAFGTDMRPLSVKLQVHLLNREGDIVGDVESKAVEIRPGEKVPGSEFAFADWLLDPDFRTRSWVLGPTFVVNHEEQYMPRACERATHALAIRVVSEYGEPLPTFVRTGKPMMCVTIRR